jgi:hypothetical protein
VDGENKPALIALRDRREAVIAELSTHFTNDALGLAEFEQRIDLAHRASAPDDLEALLADLHPVGRPGETSLVRQNKPKGHVRCFVSSVQRKGAWLVPQLLRVSTVMGAIDLDFRDAEFGPGVTEVRLRTVMGAITILVPPDLRVETAGRAILGHFEHLDQSGLDDEPVLRITGVAVMGSVEISSGERDLE